MPHYVVPPALGLVEGPEVANEGARERDAGSDEGSSDHDHLLYSGERPFFAEATRGTPLV